VNDELAAIVGTHEQLVEILQEKYDIVKKGVERQVDVFKDIIEQLKNPIGS